MDVAVLAASLGTSDKTIRRDLDLLAQGGVVGPMTEAALRGMRLDTVVLTCCGFSVADGVMAHDLRP